MDKDHRHTFLFESGKWKAIGSYFDEDGYPVDVHGETVIRTGASSWILEGYMELELDKPLKIVNRYLIEPFDSSRDQTIWASENPALGRLKGTFTVVNDTIISLYQSENGKFSGTEMMLFIDEDHYQNWGVLYGEETKISSWEVMLERVS